MSEAAASRTSAVVTGERLAVLDILRGFALLGVLLVNIPFAGMPMDWVLSPVGGAAAPLTTLIPWVLVKGLGWTKFVTLFSLLFGMGLVLQIDRAASTRFYLRRLAILAVIGLLHGLLLWSGDILFPYAVAGFILYLLRKKSPRKLVTLAIPFFVIGIALSSLWPLLEEGEAVEDGAVAASESVVRDPAGFFGDGGRWEETKEKAWKEGPLGQTLMVRAVEYLGWLGLSSLISFNWHVMALFLTGAAIMKKGWLAAEHRRAHGRLAGLGIAAGLALEALATLLQLRSGFAEGMTGAVATMLHEVGSLTLAAGYLGAVAWTVHGGKLEALYTPLSAVGRTALTSYLGQSVAFNLLFLWYGFGLWGELGWVEILALGFAVYAVQMVLATLWLRKFAMGPCEWIWRWMTYGRRPRLLA